MVLPPWGGPVLREAHEIDDDNSPVASVASCPHSSPARSESFLCRRAARSVPETVDAVEIQGGDEYLLVFIHLFHLSVAYTAASFDLLTVTTAIL